MTDQNRNLALRVLTAVVLLPLVIYLLWLGGLPFTLLISVAAAAAALEVNLLPSFKPLAPPPLPEDASRKDKKRARVEAVRLDEDRGVLSGAAIASVGAAFVLPLLEHAPVPYLTAPAVLSALTILAFADALLFERDLTRAPIRVGVAVLAAAWCGLLLGALVPLRALPNGAWWILLALTVTWANDTGGYFAGRAFGKRKLYPRISPSKTWEGAVGGLAGSVGGAVIVKALFLPELPVWAAALIGLGAAVMGPLGDLSESMLKRAWGAKDSGRLLPGHGGLLDRIDALLFNAPFVLLCARLIVDPH